jgi:hypothetical protein
MPRGQTAAENLIQTGDAGADTWWRGRSGKIRRSVFETHEGCGAGGEKTVSVPASTPRRKGRRRSGSIEPDPGGAVPIEAFRDL